MAPKTPSQTTTTQEIPPAFKPAFLSLFNSAFGAARQQANPFEQQQGFPIFNQTPAQSFFGGSGGQGGFASQLGGGFQGQGPGGGQGAKSPGGGQGQRGSGDFAQQAGGTPNLSFNPQGGSPFQGGFQGGAQESFAGGQARPTGFPTGGQGGAPQQNFTGQTQGAPPPPPGSQGGPPFNDPFGQNQPPPPPPSAGFDTGGKNGGSPISNAFSQAGQFDAQGNPVGTNFGFEPGPFGTPGSQSIPLAGGPPIVGQPFEGPFTAATSPLEFESLARRELVGRQLGGVGNDLQNLGQQTARGDFLNPGVNSALGTAIQHALQPAVDQFGRSVMPQFSSQALGSGAFKGSSAREFAGAQLANDFGRNILGTAGTIGAENFFRERQLQQNAGQLIDQAARLNQLSPEILAQTGEGQRALGQRGLDENLLRFQESQLAPFRPLLPLASIIQGGDIGSAGTAQNFAAQPGGVASGIASALGGGGVGAGIGDTFGQGGAGAGLGGILGLLAGLA